MCYFKSRDGTLHGPPKPSFHTRCVFTEGGVKCGDRIIPCSKFCRKHILEDKKQVLFRACNIEKAGVLCREPVPGIFEDATCTLHIQLPPQRNYTQRKYESESDDETMSMATSPNIKKEEPNETETVIKSETCNDVDMSNVSDKPASEATTESQSEIAETNNVTICHDEEPSENDEAPALLPPVQSVETIESIESSEKPTDETEKAIEVNSAEQTSTDDAKDDNVEMVEH